VVPVTDGAPLAGAADLVARSRRERRTVATALRTQRRALRIVLVSADALLLSLAFATAFVVRFRLGLAVFQFEVQGNEAFYQQVVYALIPLWLVIFAVAGLYDGHNLLGGTREYALVFHAVSAGMLVVILATFLRPDLVIARGWVLVSWVLAFLFVAAGRFFARRAVYLLRRRGWFLSRALVIGANDEARAMGEQLASWHTSGLELVGFVDPRGASAGRVVRGLFVLGDLEAVDGLVARFGVEELIIATSALSRDELVDLFRRYTPRQDVQLRLSSGLFEVMTTGLAIKELAYVPLINVQPVRLTGIDTVLKASLDYGLALGLLALGAPMLLLLAAIVRLDSPGPVLHRRRVLGLGGRPFDAYKLRTMHADGQARLVGRDDLRRELADSHKLRDDPRVTRVGRILRKASLDELPQLVNVLRGEMSVVGPRMISPEEHSRYGRWDMNLLTVKPGITGLWQVSGRSDISYEERVRLDMNYIRNWTIWLDLQILLQTIPVVIRGRGAY